MTDFGANFPDPDEMQAQLQSVFGPMIQQLREMLRPVVAKQVRDVLERNEGLVSQDPTALEFLTAELVDAVMPEEIF